MTPKHYIRESDLRYQILLSQGKGLTTLKLHQYLYLIVTRVQYKFDYYYPQDQEDCLSEAYLTVASKYNRFDGAKYEFALPYVTELAKRALADAYNKIVLRKTHASQPYVPMIGMTDNVALYL